MSRRLTHILLALVLLLSSEVWAIGLGDIRLDSALNEPLRAEISLLSATPEELSVLSIALASPETFARYGIDRPVFLQEIEFEVASGADGGVVRLRSSNPISEPFLTFLIEVTWPSGRLMREYTVLLDPPSFMPAGSQQAPAVSAPSRSTPADSGRIERQQPAAPSPVRESRPAPQPSRPPQPARSAPVDETPYDTRGSRDYVVQRNDTLWGIASRMRPDDRLTMNQTMLAIFEANRDAFGGNINLLRAGASLRIPSADEVFQISRGNAFSEVQRQNEAWSSGSSYTAPRAETRPSLTLVPPDEEPAGVAYDGDLDTSESLTREQQLEARINELESADVPDQPSLLEIRDDELAALRQELANIRGEAYEPPVGDVDDSSVEDQVDGEALVADDTAVDDQLPDQVELGADADADADVADAAVTEAPSTVVRTAPSSKPGIVDRILGALTSVWGAIGAALVLVAGLLFWFMRRDGDEIDEPGPWKPLDSDDIESKPLTATETIRPPSTDEAFVVVEQDSAIREISDDTAEIPAVAEIGDETVEDSGVFASIEDTFSSDTAVNLDQTDPIAEADFHMAYGLYDQAADLINGALEGDPEDTGLMSKLCEIYFVWGNRNSFVDAARNLQAAAGDGQSSEWDKIVIMGQQIAADDEMFAGADVAAATQAVDLSFDSESGEAGALDMDFGGGETGTSDAIDLGGDGDDVDFLFDESTAESPTIEAAGTEKTLAMPAQEDTAETPTIEQKFGEVERTSELPSLDPSQAQADAGQAADATAEINLDDLDLDIAGLAETELGSLDDLDVTGSNIARSDVVFGETSVAVTDDDVDVDSDSTGELDSTDLEDLIDPDSTGEMRLAADDTGRSPQFDAADDAMDVTEVSIDESLLDATGLTQVLDDDMAVDTGAGLDSLLADDEATLLASLDDDADEFKFAKTEALPGEVFDEKSESEETGEIPALAGTDVDLDLDDLTAALKVGGSGDTIDQLRDDKTVEQPRPSMAENTAEVPTMSLGPEDVSEDLHEARTMTEVGTKLDLARAYVDMGDPAGARSILEEVLDEGDEGQRQQAQQLLDSLPG